MKNGRLERWPFFFVRRLECLITAKGMTLVWDYPHPYTMALTPQPADIDGLNHTNNAVYVQWCEKIGWAHSQALGLGLADYQRLDRAMAIHRAEYDYLLPTLLDEELTLATWLLDSDGKLGMRRGFQLVRARDGVTVLRGRWQLVCIEIGSGRARRMPDEFRAVYLPALALTAAASAPAAASSAATAVSAAADAPSP